MKKYIDPSDEDLPEGHKDLKYYQAATFKGISVLLKKDMSDSQFIFQEMFMSKSLKLNLANQKIVEYPVFYVVINNHINSYLEQQFKKENALFKDDSNSNENSFKNNTSVNASLASGYFCHNEIIIHYYSQF